MSADSLHHRFFALAQKVATAPMPELYSDDMARAEQTVHKLQKQHVDNTIQSSKVWGGLSGTEARRTATTIAPGAGTATGNYPLRQVGEIAQLVRRRTEQTRGHIERIGRLHERLLGLSGIGLNTPGGPSLLMSQSGQMVQHTRQQLTDLKDYTKQATDEVARLTKQVKGAAAESKGSKPAWQGTGPLRKKKIGIPTAVKPWFLGGREAYAREFEAYTRIGSEGAGVFTKMHVEKLATGRIYVEGVVVVEVPPGSKVRVQVATEHNQGEKSPLSMAVNPGLNKDGFFHLDGTFGNLFAQQAPPTGPNSMFEFGPGRHFISVSNEVDATGLDNTWVANEEVRKLLVQATAEFRGSTNGVGTAGALIDDLPRDGGMVDGILPWMTDTW